ncbi:hypothetical protein SERLA73DRAFT_161474 [Serpula lacrymans var. lacrymans S7.3]|uniref:Enhancer of polycomb-like protein n=2 Tax=Serpula lacrymans var. lacrymans TaxID=341189 RepID=F8Q2M3_SERL3|nr:uncharacterized protein SERLADRAFT_416527 [Serpula lacrymans var. lacrymans S7.9]EGN97434.1 hypothetical protein SERLA73DRAFT_161474 [Serpula lacrymans var. lacrymans S7.3]EGO23025.1 hypothetical protein SERLADRAFT_416527 [Serpula lacrymans var. lacrymans S7.9]
MPRNHNLGTSTLRNRNRVTNKTRLKVYHGNIDADPLVLDEDEEKARIVSTAGVDAEDANEHHLQAVLSAASQRHQSVVRSTRGAAEKVSTAPAAFIPTPDSTGVVDNYEEFYPSGRWKDPVSYIKSSETVDEACAHALVDGFAYFMDERDKEWFDRNNEEARGEGTSAQGAFSVPGTTTRSGSTQRSAKAKGKEPDVAQPMVMSEDEFELIMGLFEKVTHEKTEFLHHGLEQGMTFPPFSEYQDTFTSPFTPAIFTSFTVPSWIPSSAQLLRLARMIYPYWRERRIERGGHRIIPALNFDEADVINESYICFRRREIKAVRKTRASQATSSDKLLRLQSELSISLELAKSVLTRENIKKDAAQQAIQVWEKRMEFVNMKRKFSSLGSKEDEDLLHDKERVPKKPKVENMNRATGLKLRPRDSNDLNSPAMQLEALIRPKERYTMITGAVDRDMARQKERDHQWEDLLTNPYQPSPVPYTQRHWKPFFASRSTSPSLLGRDEEDDDDTSSHVRYLRIRFARARRLCLDRHDSLVKLPALHQSSSSGVSDRKAEFMRRMRQFDDDGDEERVSKLHERWRFDDDDSPVVGPEGPDEQDRVLIDDYEPRYLRHAMTLIQDRDQQDLLNDPTIVLSTAEGRHQAVAPFRMGMQPPMRREMQAIARPYPSGSGIQTSRPLGSLPLSSPLPNGVPISMQAHVKAMQPPSSVSHLRISSNGGMRPPMSSPTAANMAANNLPSHSSPPHPPTGVATNGVNGVNHNSHIPADGDSIKLTAAANGAPPNGVSQAQNEVNMAANVDVAQPTQSPVRPKSDNQHPAAITIPNGYHVTPMNGYPPMANGSPYMHHANRQHNGLSAQQMQSLKVAFAGQDPNALHASGRTLPGSYVGHVVPNAQHFNVQLGNNLNLKLPPTRQWAQLASPSQQQMALSNDPVAGGMPSPNVHQMALPARTPSANGSRASGRGTSISSMPSSVGHMMGGGQLTSHSVSPHLQHSPPSLSTALTQLPQQSSPHLQTPTLKMASPALQHQQPVGNSQGGY